MISIYHKEIKESHGLDISYNIIDSLEFTYQQKSKDIKRGIPIMVYLFFYFLYYD